MTTTTDSPNRCPWCVGSELYLRYHDDEWGVPVHDDRVHFEFLILEGAQAGLSWSTILRKREAYREAFAGFDPAKVARFTDARLERLLRESKVAAASRRWSESPPAAIVRNRLKVYSAANNARRFLDVQREFGSFDRYIWGFVSGKPIVNRWKTLKQIPATSRQSDELSKDLRKRGFKFVGSTIMYAHMQACGLVNDHLVDCWRYARVAKEWRTALE